MGLRQTYFSQLHTYKVSFLALNLLKKFFFFFFWQEKAQNDPE